MAPLPARMNAIRIHNYGGLETLHYEEVARPTPSAGEVLVRVYAAAVNPFDWKLRKGYARLPLEWSMRPGYTARHSTGTLPIILGFDVAGVIAAVGDGVQGFAVGDKVYGSPRLGGYAEYVALPVEEVAHKPERLDFVQAAALPIAAASAWQGLFEVLDLKPGQRVLIHGAAGGIGVFAVQLAKWRGAHVTGTASSHNLAFLRKLGVDHAVDYTTTPVEEMVRESDAVLDLVGGATQERSLQALKATGILATVNNPLTRKVAAANPPRSYVYKMLRPIGSDLVELARIVEDGKLIPFVSTVLPLQEARQAHALSESGHTRGKIVLQVGG